MTGPGWDPRLSTWLDEVGAAWSRAGLTRTVREELWARLVEDLSQALRDGAPIDELIAGDPSSFARDVAAAAGHALPPAGPPPAVDQAFHAKLADRLSRLPDRTRFVVAAIAGALGGAVLGMLTAYPACVWFIDTYSLTLSDHVKGAIALVMWATVALMSAGAAGFAVGSLVGDTVHRRRLAWSATISLLASGAVITLPTMAVARAHGYPSNLLVATATGPRPGTVFLEVALVLAALLGGLVLAGELTWRRTSRVPHDAP